ncbi:prepilin peptidase [Nocardioides zhouii]|uniref:Prepilin peptidase n=1 Tax=Nocardioides zhouii TaxID=1168729 RepID=A0A4V1RQR9_9ACTN|nr:A24 family peptidase [Nocardioides zhouii]RYC13817.1 prepilin peptidase [Nocardioides zhouii]
MNDAVLAALLGLLVAGLGGLLVPRLIASVPEPAPKKSEAAPDETVESEADPPATPEAEEPPKTAYVDIAARPGLGVRSAAISAVCGAVLGAATGLDWPLLWLLPLTPVAVALSVIDWHTRLLPRRIVVPVTLAAILLVVVVGLMTDQRDHLVSALVVMVVARSFFWVLWAVLGGAGMGFGDVRLAAPVGLVLGWVGPGPALLGFWIGMVIFGLPGLLLAIVKRDRSLMKKPFPFGPFMIVGALVGLVWGTALAGRIWG